MVFLQPVHSAIQTSFPWGKLGGDSLAGQLWLKGGHAQAQEQTNQLDEHTPYAEFWQGGTHEKGPSTLINKGEDAPHSTKKGEPLSKVLRARKHELLGERLLKKMPWVDTDTHGGVPVLFKVLSCRKALPLQAHPDAELSRKLYEADPGQEDEEQVRYDGVHKPEIALALTPFRGFIGFAPHELIARRMELLPELRDLLLARNAPVEISKHLVQSMVDPYHEIVDAHQRVHSSYSWRDRHGAALGRLLGQDKKKLSSAIKQIVKRAEQQDGNGSEAWPGPEGAQLRLLILELNEQYPGDSGVLAAPVFMNLAELEPGECIYAPSDTIHAWLSGDIIEAMPASVNVENAAFGPDPSVETVRLFTHMLTYEAKPTSAFKIAPEPVPGTPESTTTIYRIPLEEFDVVKVVLSGPASSSVKLFAQGGDDEAGGLGLLDGIAIVGVVRGGGTIRGWDGHSGDVSASDGDSHEVSEGSVLVVGRGTAIELSSASGLEAYVAVCQPKTP